MTSALVGKKFYVVLYIYCVICLSNAPYLFLKKSSLESLPCLSMCLRSTELVQMECFLQNFIYLAYYCLPCMLFEHCRDGCYKLARESIVGRLEKKISEQLSASCRCGLSLPDRNDKPSSENREFFAENV